MTRIPMRGWSSLKLGFCIPGAAADLSSETTTNPRAAVGLLFPANYRRKFSTGIVGGGHPDDGAAAVNGGRHGRRAPRAEAAAQAALLDYLHVTRGLQFIDAEHTSKNCPIFIRKLLHNVRGGKGGRGDAGRAIARFFLYHPVNEFEPFLESIGLKPAESSPFLPRDLMYLADAGALVENVRLLCDYGITRGKIGRIYKEAGRVFSCGVGVLASKLRAYEEELGLSRSGVAKLVTCCPCLVAGEGLHPGFVKLLAELESVGIHGDWLGEHLSEDGDYNFQAILILLRFLADMGLEELGEWLRTHPSFLLDRSGETGASMAVLLLKMGAGKEEIGRMLSQVPCHMQAGTFVKNMVRCLEFLRSIKMDREDVERILRAHASALGQFTIKKSSSVLCDLGVGRTRLCEMVRDDPLVLRRFAMGSKLSRLPSPAQEDIQRSLAQRKRFLLNLGYVEGSEEMEKALRTFRGDGERLEERFDALVRLGIDPADARAMVRLAPHILNQKASVLERKIGFFLSQGYSLSCLVAFPSYLAYTVERVKLRLLMYGWLREKGKAKEGQALSGILACSDETFARRFVDHHPEGPLVWERFREELANSIVIS